MAEQGAAAVFLVVVPRQTEEFLLQKQAQVPDPLVSGQAEQVLAASFQEAGNEQAEADLTQAACPGKHFSMIDHLL